ncbi:MAG: hypothetical protein Q7S58_07825 [Candidatus Binatus sp.]|uniref:hypothetical protein n=1 Tax=Candidatus Binatus sp. TaxID=2811406 RepID=UPI00271D57A4|nr:hypothetical protein [Candidatus Binatus sp.]MDO8432303.1 hypothetical protein [Candidatus Binatus sp.]
MRNGPLVHRRARASRFAYGTPTPLERLHALAAFGSPHTFARHARPAAPEAARFEPQRLHLGSRLPINLRHFLAEQLGPTMRIEDDTIVALRPSSSEALMRELARAIRRFSAERAREAWSECAILLDRLEREFFASVSDECGPVVLCLRCSCVGAGPLDQHCGTRCLPVHLGAEVRAQQLEGKCANGTLTPDALHHAVEHFRNQRTEAGLPHYDLDCYVAGGQVIFTWRPLPA